MCRLTAFAAAATLLFLVTGSALAQTPNPQRPGTLPASAEKPLKLNLAFRVVRVTMAPTGKPVGQPQVVRSQVDSIVRNAPVVGVFFFTVGKDGARTALPGGTVTSMGVATTDLTSPFYEFRVGAAATRLRDDGFVTLKTNVRARGAFPTRLAWPEANQRVTVTGKLSLAPGQAPVRIAGVTTADDPEVRARVLRGESPRNAQAYTAYYLEVSSEIAPINPSPEPGAF